MKEDFALHLIPCSGKKNPGGIGRPWMDARVEAHQNIFPDLDEERIRLLDFYGSLPKDRAKNIYVATRGKKKAAKVEKAGKNKKKDKVEKTWEKNLVLRECPTMSAILRYSGTLYDNLGCEVRNLLLKGSIKNVLIVSAMFGILSPKDSIPNYELMMKDRSPGNSMVYKYWLDAFRRQNLTDVLRTYAPQCKSIFCFMSKPSGYVSAVSCLAKDFEVWNVDVEHGSTARSSEIWGQKLRSCLLEGASTEHEVCKILGNDARLKKVADSVN